jgi:hypothetical protein
MTTTLFLYRGRIDGERRLSSFSLDARGIPVFPQQWTFTTWSPPTSETAKQAKKQERSRFAAILARAQALDLVAVFSLSTCFCERSHSRDRGQQSAQVLLLPRVQTALNYRAVLLRVPKYQNAG